MECTLPVLYSFALIAVALEFLPTTSSELYSLSPRVVNTGIILLLVFISAFKYSIAKILFGCFSMLPISVI